MKRIICLRCENNTNIKHGQHKGLQRYKCCACCYIFTDTRLVHQLRIIALLAHDRRMDISAIAHALVVPQKIVRYWIDNRNN